MRAGGTAGGSNRRNSLPALHRVTDFHQQPLVVRIARHQSVAMINLDNLAVTKSIARPGHHTFSYGDDLRAFRCGEINALMNCGVTVERVRARAEVRRN